MPPSSPILEPFPRLARVQTDTGTLVWSGYAASPLGLDVAALALLDAFGAGATTEEVAADLAEAIDIDRQRAQDIVDDAAQSFLDGRLLKPGDDEPPEVRFLHYPPLASL